jgi:hypothetical protein
LLSDTAKGFALVFCSIALLPLSLDFMQDHDDAENEFERECDPVFRALTGNNSAVDAEICSQLEEDRSTKLILFTISLATFVITGLIGMAMVLPINQNQT